MGEPGLGRLRILRKVCLAQVRALLDGGYRAADKEMRNEFLLVAKMLASEERIRLSFFQSGFVKLAVAAAISCAHFQPQLRLSNWDTQPTG